MKNDQRRDSQSDRPDSGRFDGRIAEAIDEAQTIFYITDNAGEIVYDRLLIEMLISPEFNKDVTVAVRGEPIITTRFLKAPKRQALPTVPVIGNAATVWASF